MKRELLFSFVGHVLVVAVLAAVSAGRVAHDLRRPEVLSVSVLSAGSPFPQTPTKGASVVEPRPASHKPAPASAKTEPKQEPGVFRRQGLGARIEGAEALGYSYYLNVVLSRISDNWLNPYQGQAVVRSATIVFVIERDGTVHDVLVEKGSGDAGYDVAAQRALLVLDKLPPLPPEFTGPRLKLHLEFEQKP